jgi:RNA polymerase sigma-70 factor, ECF subfamily
MRPVSEGEGWLSPLFLSELGASARERFEDSTQLEATLAAHLESGRAAWPTFDVAPEHYVRHLAVVVEEGETSASRMALESLHGSDLYLAAACSQGDASAIGELERVFIANLEAPLRSTGLDSSGVDEVRQRVREILLVGDGVAPGIARYGGRSQLRSWIRSIAVRQSARHVRGRMEVPADVEMIEVLPDLAADPKLAVWKRRYAAEFRVAFDQAVAQLGARERTLLRQHHIDGLTVDALAGLYRVHRATAARWVARARALLLEGIRARLIERLHLSQGELDSFFRLVRSQIDVSLHEILRAPPNG